MLSLDVPPILKKYRSELTKDITQHGKVFYIDEKLTSKACPSCNDTLTKDKVYQLF